MSDKPRLSRREWLTHAGLAGTAAVIPAPLARVVGAAPSLDGMTAEPQAPAAREAFETLTAAESDTLEAITARLIPADALGPGAAQARAAHYIDRALGGPLSAARAAYAAGLAAVNAYAQSSKGAPFARLAAADQDAVLADMERNAATGFTPDAATFFDLVRGHTIEGTFSDPYYGGNANFVGWDLIRYPGVRVAVADSEQQLTPPPPNHRSAYDFPMFGKGRSSAATGHKDHDRGD